MLNNNIKILRIIISVLALTGIVIMGYLTYIHYANTQSFCDISETISCDVVTTSIYSEIFGIPISIFGLLYFVFIFYLGAFKKTSKAFQTIFITTLFFIIPSLYFTLTEILFIEAFCILCEGSKLTMLLILIASGLGTHKEFKLNIKNLTPIIIAGLIAAFVIYFAQTGNVVQKDYSELVQCMNEQSVTYYKSFKCNSCKRQEKLLGDAYLQLNSVECHPDGPSGDPELCFAKNIAYTPTFIIEINGTEVKRIEGLQSIESLASFANCPVE